MRYSGKRKIQKGNKGRKEKYIRDTRDRVRRGRAEMKILKEEKSIIIKRILETNPNVELVDSLPADWYDPADDVEGWY